MNFQSELIPGVRQIGLDRFEDVRGIFVKTISKKLHLFNGIDIAWKEEFYSISKKHVIRGMHFQIPPYDQAKLVFCPIGAVLDVLLDLRKGPSYGTIAYRNLDSAEPTVLVIPSGVAHGFRSLVDESLLVYKTSSEYSPEHDLGIRWDSFGFDWGVEHPIISDRDAAHLKFVDFISPF